MNVIKRLTAEVTSLRGALRTLKMTTPIARNPGRVFPQVVLELADKYGDAPALLSDGESSPIANLRPAPTVMRAGHWRKTCARATRSAC